MPNVPDRLTEQDIERVAHATERAALRGTLRALGYLALVGVGVWLAITLLAITFVYVAPPPGAGIDLGGWLLLAVVLIAIGAGAYFVFHTIRAALK